MKQSNRGLQAEAAALPPRWGCWECLIWLATAWWLSHLAWEATDNHSGKCPTIYHAVRATH